MSETCHNHNRIAYWSEKKNFSLHSNLCSTCFTVSPHSQSVSLTHTVCFDLYFFDTAIISHKSRVTWSSSHMLCCTLNSKNIAIKDMRQQIWMTALMQRTDWNWFWYVILMETYWFCIGFHFDIFFAQLGWVLKLTKYEYVSSFIGCHKSLPLTGTRTKSTSDTRMA